MIDITFTAKRVGYMSKELGFLPQRHQQIWLEGMCVIFLYDTGNMSFAPETSMEKILRERQGG